MPPTFTLRVEIRPTAEEPGFVAKCVELDTMTWGTSLDELRTQVEDMIRSYFLSCADLGTLDDVVRQLSHEQPVRPTVPPEPVTSPGLRRGAVRWRTQYAFEDEHQLDL